MADAANARIWTRQVAFACLALGIVFLQLLPLNTQPRVWPMPDWLLLVTLVWVIRRPDFVPVAVVAALFLLTDLLFHRPPGLMTALVVILTEILRARSAGLRSVTFGVEWLTAAAALAGLTVANRVALGFVMTPQAPLGLTLIQMLMTILAYPVVVGLARAAFGVSRPAPGEVNALGQRL